jgi:hypothetical protein
MFHLCEHGSAVTIISVENYEHLFPNFEGSKIKHTQWTIFLLVNMFFFLSINGWFKMNESPRTSRGCETHNIHKQQYLQFIYCLWKWYQVSVDKCLADITNVYTFNTTCRSGNAVVFGMMQYCYMKIKFCLNECLVIYCVDWFHWDQNLML